MLLLCVDEIDLDNDEDEDGDTLCPLHQEKKAPQAIMGLSGRYRAPLANSPTPEYIPHTSLLLFSIFYFVYVACFSTSMQNCMIWTYFICRAVFAHFSKGFSGFAYFRSKLEGD